MTADNRSDRRRGTDGANAGFKPATRMRHRILFLLCCLALFGVSIYEYWQITVVREMLDQAHVELAVVQKALDSLIGEISAAGENLSQSDLAMRSEIKDVNKEIRKLWDLANKRNKQDISKHNDRLGALDIKMDKLALESNKMLSSVVALKNEGDGHAQRFKSLYSDHAALKLELVASREALLKLKKMIEENRKRHAGTEKVVDSFRVQVNRKLLQLENSVRVMNKPSEKGL
ncbi:MAG: hypothetical protein QS748_09135 [Candidatus Endonucleobacter bathymodioli]|uniref:Uncharacterized protein n=1 Tax=Candidatus Endonucleibacter bathymodioli TaxID=539814 RepID=A0AA90NM88_9GAMM|nr:hypothetical protein [Candidatus Endonucleobacter bathymodioli]